MRLQAQLGKVTSNGWVAMGILFVPVVLLAQAPTGQIRGSVVDQSGHGLANAMVVVNIRSVPSGAFTPYTAVATSDSSGSFLVTGVPAGKFDVCPQLRGSNLLPICAWQAAPSVTVAAGQKVTMPAIALKAAAVLPILVSDPLGIVATATAGATASVKVATIGTGASVVSPAPPSVEIYITGNYGPPLPATGTGTVGARSALVPYDTPVKVFVFTKGLSLTDTAGAPVSATQGKSTTVTIPSGSTPSQLTYTVQGLVP